MLRIIALLATVGGLALIGALDLAGGELKTGIAATLFAIGNYFVLS